MLILGRVENANLSGLVLFFSIVADYQEISSKFCKNRTQLPAIFISTPKDKFSSMWTKDKPSKQVS